MVPFSAQGIGFAFLLGLSYVCYTITGFDASAHTSEETQDAQVNVPKGMWQAVFWSWVFGLVAVAAYVLTMQGSIFIQIQRLLAGTLLLKEGNASHLISLPLVALERSKRNRFCWQQVCANGRAQPGWCPDIVRRECSRLVHFNDTYMSIICLLESGQ